MKIFPVSFPFFHFSGIGGDPIGCYRLDFSLVLANEYSVRFVSSVICSFFSMRNESMSALVTLVKPFDFAQSMQLSIRDGNSRFSEAILRKCFSSCLVFAVLKIFA